MILDTSVASSKGTGMMAILLMGLAARFHCRADRPTPRLRHITLSDSSAALLSSPPFLRGRSRIICSSRSGEGSRGSGRDGRPAIEGGEIHRRLSIGDDF